MSSNANAGGAGETPEDIAKQAAQKAFARLENAPDDPYARLDAEGEATELLIDGLVRAVNNGLQEAHTGAIIGNFTDEVSATKTEVKSLFEDALGDAGPTTDDPTLDVFLTEELEEVVASRSTDHNQDTTYSWRFCDGNYVFETQATGEGAFHFSPDRLRKEIHAVMGRLPKEPSDSVAENWTECICSIIDKKKTETETQGRRSAGVEALGNHIRNSVAYGTLEAAAQSGGVYKPGEDAPNDHQGEIWVSNEAIVQICDEKELTTTRGLQLELDARGETSDSVRGASDQTFVNGTHRTYWRLDDDFADPVAYEEDPDSPAEKAARRRADEADDGETDEATTEREDETETADDGSDGHGGPDDDEDTSNAAKSPTSQTTDDIDDGGLPRSRAVNPDLRNNHTEETTSNSDPTGADPGDEEGENDDADSSAGEGDAT